MDILTILGGITLALTLISMYLVGVPNILCWPIFSISYLIQIFIFYRTEQWFLILTMTALIIFSVVNYYRWKHQGVG